MKHIANSLIKVPSLLVKNLFNEENRSKIIKVLKWNFKPLFGIDSFLYLHGHRHVGPLLHWTLKNITNDLFSEDINPTLLFNQISKLIKKGSFKETLRVYKKDINYICSLVKNAQITTIGLEDTNEWVSSIINSKGSSLVDNVSLRLTNLWLDGQSVNEFVLVLFGPVIYLYVAQKLPGINIVWVEWETYKKVMRDLTMACQLIKIKDKDYVSLFESVFDKTEQRNKEIVQYLEQTLMWSKTLLVIGAGHTKGIKQLMEKHWKVTPTKNLY